MKLGFFGTSLAPKKKNEILVPGDRVVKISSAALVNPSADSKASLSVASATDKSFVILNLSNHLPHSALDLFFPGPANITLSVAGNCALDITGFVSELDVMGPNFDDDDDEDEEDDAMAAMYAQQQKKGGIKSIMQDLREAPADEDDEDEDEDDDDVQNFAPTSFMQDLIEEGDDDEDEDEEDEAPQPVAVGGKRKQPAGAAPAAAPNAKKGKGKDGAPVTTTPSKQQGNKKGGAPPAAPSAGKANAGAAAAKQPKTDTPAIAKKTVAKTPSQDSKESKAQTPAKKTTTTPATTPKAGQLKCPECPKTMSNQNALDQHLASKHKQKTPAK